MSGQPVTPDREALARLLLDQVWDDDSSHPRLTVHDNHVFHGACALCRGDAWDIADALLPLLTDALDRARQQGRDEAAAAIEADGSPMIYAPRAVLLARGEFDGQSGASGEERNAVQGRWDGGLPGHAEPMPATTTATPASPDCSSSRLARGGPNRKDEE